MLPGGLGSIRETVLETGLVASVCRLAAQDVGQIIQGERKATGNDTRGEWCLRGR